MGCRRLATVRPVSNEKVARIGRSAPSEAQARNMVTGDRCSVFVACAVVDRALSHGAPLRQTFLRIRFHKPSLHLASHFLADEFPKGAFQKWPYAVLDDAGVTVWIGASNRSDDLQM